MWLSVSLRPIHRSFGVNFCDAISPHDWFAPISMIRIRPLNLVFWISLFQHEFSVSFACENVAAAGAAVVDVMTKIYVLTERMASMVIEHIQDRTALDCRGPSDARSSQYFLVGFSHCPNILTICCTIVSDTILPGASSFLVLHMYRLQHHHCVLNFCNPIFDQSM